MESNKSLIHKSHYKFIINGVLCTFHLFKDVFFHFLDLYLIFRYIY